MGAHLPLKGRNRLDGTIAIVSDAWPVRRLTYRYRVTYIIRLIYTTRRII